MIHCGVENCDNKATYQVQLSLAVDATHTPAVSTPILHLCSEHRDKYTKEDFFKPAQMISIENGFLKHGKQAPKKEFCDIIISPIPPMN